MTLPGQMVGELRRTAAGTQLRVDHQHAVLEFNLVLRGSGRYQLEDTEIALKPGVMVWIAPGRRHRLTRSAHLQMWVGTVRPDLVSAQWLMLIDAEPAHAIGPRDQVELDRLFGEIAQDSDDMETYNAGIVYAIRRAQRATRVPSQQRQDVHPAVGRALLLMREEGGRLTLPELAARTGVAASYLSRLFVAQTQRPFVEWRNRFRLLRFMTRFRDGDTLLRAAEDAGFGSYAQFHRVFQELVGTPPRQWLRERASSPGADPDVIAASLDSYAVPLPALSGRERWSSLLPFTSPLIASCLGEDFLSRLRHGSNDGTQLTPETDAPLSNEVMAQALHAHHVLSADALSELAKAQDFAALHSLLLGCFGLSAQCLSDGIAAYLVTLWVTATQAPTPSAAQCEAVLRQVRAWLAHPPRRWPAATRRDLQALLACHVVVLARAIEATRASADPADVERLRSAAQVLALSTLGPGLENLRLTDAGFSAIGEGHREAAPQRDTA
ncbi:MAG TPA: helix-turn-helix domain-containing protein [Stenotrophomonas sp.]|nr:helix-turn-helix domain-containing protein [Stenotrophomonas sp.]